jgi:hypothetical protein
MPYKIYKSGSQWCVHKKNPDGSKGKKKGCHGSRSEATAHLRALYHAENKENIMSTEDGTYTIYIGGGDNNATTIFPVDIEEEEEQPTEEQEEQ